REGNGVEGPQVDITLGDRLDPRLASAPRVGDVRDAGLRQVVVVPRDVSANEVTYFRDRSHRRRLAEDAAHQVAIDQVLPVEVALEVGDRLATVTRAFDPEILRALGAHRHPAVRDGTDVGLREGVAVAEPGTGEVVGFHVDDAVGRGADPRL